MKILLSLMAATCILSSVCSSSDQRFLEQLKRAQIIQDRAADVRYRSEHTKKRTP